MFISGPLSGINGIEAIKIKSDTLTWHAATCQLGGQLMIVMESIIMLLFIYFEGDLRRIPT